MGTDNRIISLKDETIVIDLAPSAYQLNVQTQINNKDKNLTCYRDAQQQAALTTILFRQTRHEMAMIVGPGHEQLCKFPQYLPSLSLALQQDVKARFLFLEEPKDDDALYQTINPHFSSNIVGIATKETKEILTNSLQADEPDNLLQYCLLDDDKFIYTLKQTQFFGIGGLSCKNNQKYQNHFAKAFATCRFG